ncbi:hypothetical protein RFM41_33265 [Mesorhizobium sp. VK25A]|uniref:Transposase n=1 Tax=Mesorhizobium vachelliae TaxID=3072309 RepID=A0ABU5AF11_9HYPH|nr:MULTISPECIES: hypothetical protein [unclassified Mesorhizobium]MDX8535861.1 hypothetical protein [Mesorhizobium sp. VK25D]MDX8548615.1 hypothetical protein [Mesorhizobium sp. VK25A]
MTLPASYSVEDLPLADLRRLVVALIEEVTLLRAENRDLKDEIARLKGLPPRPQFKGRPSGLEKATSASSGGRGRSKRRRGAKRDKLEITAEVVVKASAPVGSRFLGYELLVQDLRIAVETVRYRRERWAGPCGEWIVAALPSGYRERL